MNLCSSGHDEVCYEGRECPCCYEMKKLQEEIDGLNSDIRGMETDIEDLRAQLEP